jgi:hypothetical protein
MTAHAARALNASFDMLQSGKLMQRRVLHDRGTGPTLARL